MIKPFWGVIDKLRAEYNNEYLIDIPGIDMSLRLTEYVRRVTPVFVTQRIRDHRRSDISKHLEELGMHSYDMFEILCRTHGVTTGPFYVSRDLDLYIDISSGHWDYDLRPHDYDNDGWL